MSKERQIKLANLSQLFPTTLSELRKELKRRKKDDIESCNEIEDRALKLDCLSRTEAERDEWHRKTRKSIMDKIKEEEKQRVTDELFQQRTEAVIPKLEGEEETSPRSGGLVSELAGEITKTWNMYPNAKKVVNELKRAKGKEELTPSVIADAIAELARKCINDPKADGNYKELVIKHLSFDTDALEWERENSTASDLAKKRHFEKAIIGVELDLKNFTKERIRKYKPASLSIISDMIKLANTLDQKGYVKEADYLDKIIVSNY